jgi:hypothetical protein
VELMLDPNDPEREAQMAALQRAAAEAAEGGDERDWRSRTPLPPGPAPQRDASAPSGPSPSASANGGGGGGGAAAAAAPAPHHPSAPASSDPNAKMQKASDLGRTAWALGAAEVTAEGAAAALRKVKGILNKLTPEKFERLLSQLIPLVSSYETLQGTIHQVFENAVAQPTFVAMYADLCAELDAALPEFTPAGAAAGAGPQSFKKLLANTCQEEYEATEEARVAAAAVGEDAERKAKQRVLGNVRLISELFKKGMVNDRIMALILGELLGGKDGEPVEEALEAACELLAVAGAALEGSPRSRARLDAAFVQLQRLAGAKAYSPRIRFVVRDVIELRAQHWVARRETFTAKKLDEIRTEAQAELGILDVALPGMEPLLAGLEPMPGLAPKRAEDVELFPAFRAAAPAAGGAKGEEGGKFSAFLGAYVPLPDASNATPPEAPGQAPRCVRVGVFIFLFFGGGVGGSAVGLMRGAGGQGGGEGGKYSGGEGGSLSRSSTLRGRKRPAPRRGAGRAWRPAVYSLRTPHPSPGRPRPRSPRPRAPMSLPGHTTAPRVSTPHTALPPSLPLPPPHALAAPPPSSLTPSPRARRLRRAPRTDLTPEARESLGKSLFSDFLASRDLAEAVGTAQELAAPGFGRVLVRLGVEKAFDSLDEAEQTALADLVVELAAAQALADKDVRDAVGAFVAELGDIALDVPAAPRVLGRVLGCAAAAGLLGLDVLAAQAGCVEDAEPRRALVAAALHAARDAGGEDKLAELARAAELDLTKLLTHDPEFEAHLPSAAAFAEAQGLSALL